MTADQTAMFILSYSVIVTSISAIISISMLGDFSIRALRNDNSCSPYAPRINNRKVKNFF